MTNNTSGIEKTKLMTNNTSGINKEIEVKGQKLETVTSFNAWAQLHVTRDSSFRYSPGELKTTKTLTKFKPVWNDRSISLSSKIRLMRSLVTSIFLYAC